jgi:hypothetical protein
MTKFFALLLIAASQLAQTSPGATGSVSGQVLDADTRLPISGDAARQQAPCPTSPMKTTSRHFGGTWSG